MKDESSIDLPDLRKPVATDKDARRFQKQRTILLCQTL